MEWVLLLIILGMLTYQEVRLRKLNSRNRVLEIENSNNLSSLQELQSELLNTQGNLGQEREMNRTLLSQKKSSETRLGQISEHLVPFLENCRHDPKQMHFLGNPIDYLVFNFDEGTITFLEVKSGNSKPSKRQKTIKNIIKTGRVFYEELRINQKGIKNKIVNNLESSAPMIAEEQKESNEDPNEVK